MNDFTKIHQARESHLKAHPFDPHKHAILGHDENGIPAGFLTLPDMGDSEVLSMKFGMEFLAICHDEEEVEAWMQRVLAVAGSADLAGIMFAHAFRGIAPIIAEVKKWVPDLQDNWEYVCAEGWGKEF